MAVRRTYAEVSSPALDSLSLAVHHPDLGYCDAYLRSTYPSSDQARDGDRFCCMCGRVFEHVCDEAEGCSWALCAESEVGRLDQLAEATEVVAGPTEIRRDPSPADGVLSCSPSRVLAIRAAHEAADAGGRATYVLEARRPSERGSRDVPFLERVYYVSCVE